MKKTFNLFVLLIALGLVVGLVACKKTEAPTTKGNDVTTTEKQQDTTTKEDVT